MKQFFIILFFASITAGCGNSAEKPEKSEDDSSKEVFYFIDSTEHTDSRNTEPEGEKRKSDNMKDSLKVSFPDKKK